MTPQLAERRAVALGIFACAFLALALIVLTGALGPSSPDHRRVELRFTTPTPGTLDQPRSIP